ncbi:MAG TPA: IPT/TIG domain-containing protein, partial [Thermoanaerobaculia bacterium]|nr:IPT/TIG domain-containing protein [Thermoanaerobaculia bacterium]
MRILALLLLALPALGAPIVTRVDPPYGYRFGPTNVTITGSGFGTGPVQVFFGTYAAVVNQVTPASIRATIAPPSPVVNDTHVDLRVVVPQEGETVLAHA